jgi:hypothetical protein
MRARVRAGNVQHGSATYKPGEVIEGLSAQDAEQLFKAGAIERVEQEEGEPQESGE